MAPRIPARFTSADAARRHLESLLWRDGPVCVHCRVMDQATALKGKSTRPGVYWCNACKRPFSVTVGTVYERSHVPLNLWLYANHLLCNSESAISGHRLARRLGVSYKTAWHMIRHIREAMSSATAAEPPMAP
jgi:transposase-like protein